jgi:radical SAM superfamily enzyme YgiQ (UPF0313 family)
MRVALIKPPIGGILGLEMLTFVEPLGLECVAGALLPDGHDCRIYDLRIDGEDLGLARCVAAEPALVGIQCNFTTERNRALRIARRIKEAAPETFVVMGGHDASRDPQYFARPEVDAVAVGDGEEVIPPLVDALAHGGDLRRAPGLLLSTPGGFVPTGPAPARRSLDELALPNRQLIRHYADQYYINFRRPLALMETARGCPFKCNFCSVWKFHQSTFREKSPARVVEELRTIEAPNVFITDDIFWMNVRRGKEMAQEIKASGIRKYFTVQTRTDIICRFPELIEMWKECGELAIFLGVEKIDDEGLASVNKNNKAVNNLRAIEILKDLGVGFTCNFIVDPAWERDDFARLREFVDRHGLFNSGFSVLTPLPGTDLWDQVAAQVTTDDWELFDIIHAVLPTRLSLEDFYAEYARLWEWVLEVRYRHRGKLQTYLRLMAALLTRQVSWGAVKKGMNMAKVFSEAETFLAGHRESAARAAAAA